MEQNTFNTSQQPQNNDIKNINILKVNIIVNAVKIISFWLGTLILTSKGTLMVVSMQQKVIKYDGYGDRLDTLEKWRKNVTAYYIPKQK